VDKVAGPGGSAQREDHRDDEERREPWPPPQVADDAGAVGEPEVAIAARSKNRDVHVTREPAHEVGDEATGEVPFVARVRGREVDDAQRGRAVVGRRRERARETRFHREPSSAVGRPRLTRRVGWGLSPRPGS
jgi:hypothetical protein